MEDTLVLRLPSTELGPQASPHLLRIVDDAVPPGPPTGIEQWEVDALALAPAAAVALLLSLPESPPPGVAGAESVRFLVEACKLALELVASGKLCPALERRRELWVACWRPVTDDPADAARVALLARSMPPLLRAELSPNEAGQNPRRLIDDFLAAALDALARELLQNRLRDVAVSLPAGTGVVQPAELEVSPLASDAPDALLRQLGPLTIGEDGRDLLEVLTPAYVHLAAAAERHALRG